MQRQLDFERLISGISARFVSLPATDIEAAILDSLRQIGEFFGVEHVSLNELVDTPAAKWNSIVWYVPEMAHTLPHDVSNLKVLSQEILHQEPLVIDDVARIPADWLAERQLVNATGFKTGILSPLYIGETYVGVICIASVQEKQSWSPQTVDRVKFVGETLANALYRQRSEERLEFKARLLNAVGQAVIATTPDGTITYWNPAAEQLYGWSASEALGRNVLELTPSKASTAQAAQILENMQTGQTWSGEFLVQDRHGREFPAHVTDRPVHNEKNELVGIIGLSQDITAQKQTEQNLQYRVNFDALVSEISTDLILLEAADIDPGIETALGKIARFVTADGGYVFLISPDKSRYWLEHLWQVDEGVMDKDVLRNLDINDLPYFAGLRLQKKPNIICSVDDLPADATLERRLFAEVGYKSALEIPMLSEDDVIGYVGLYFLRRPHNWNKDEIQLLTIVGQMITNALRRKQAEQQLRQELNFHEAIIQNAASGLCVCHAISEYPYLKFTEWNRKMVEISGYTQAEINRLGWYQTVYPDPIDRERAKTRIAAMQRGHSLQSEEWTITRKDGEQRLVVITTTGFCSADGATHNLALIQDITEQNRLAHEKMVLEAQLRRSQRLDTIGTLAGGIAHDFNNLLMPIIGFAELAELRLPADHSVVPYLHQIGDAANRAKELVQQILMFSRQVEGERRPVELAPIISESLKLLRPTLPTTIQIDFVIEPNCDPVLGEPTQIHQIIMNLCTNAFQAMQKSGGNLTLELAQLTAEEAAAFPHVKLASRPYVKLVVSDTGEGMTAYVRDRIFEPFFTTRKVGEGTGLGMSVVHGIVRNYDGDIYIASEPGNGTEVAIFLPTVQTVPPPSRPSLSALPVKPATILLVDDDPTVLEVTDEMLTKFGYTVLKTGSSTEALEIFFAKADEIDLVLTDFTMPAMNGIELAQKINQLRPNTPIVLTTGHSEQTVSEFPEQLRNITVLKKPMGFVALGKAIAQTIKA
ncbi:MAG: hypothetical protein Kow0031_34670 [Anaerolineae bacterium]